MRVRAATVGDTEGERDTLAEREGTDTEAAAEEEEEGETEKEDVGLPLTEPVRDGPRDAEAQEDSEVERVSVRVAASV